jgi:predicted lipid-binding transport protein (Tim44 family)
MRGFVQGYLAGLIGQASFAATFGFAVTQIPPGIALLISLMVAIAATAIASKASSRFACKRAHHREQSYVPTKMKTTHRDLREHATS